jgi:hypothetical protein
MLEDVLAAESVASLGHRLSSASASQAALW